MSQKIDELKAEILSKAEALYSTKPASVAINILQYISMLTKAVIYLLDKSEEK